MCPSPPRRSARAWTTETVLQTSTSDAPRGEPAPRHGLGISLPPSRKPCVTTPRASSRDGDAVEQPWVPSVMAGPTGPTGPAGRQDRQPGGTGRPAWQEYGEAVICPATRRSGNCWRRRARGTSRRASAEALIRLSAVTAGEVSPRCECQTTAGRRGHDAPVRDGDAAARP